MSTTATAIHEALVRENFNAWAKSQTFERLRPWLAYIQRHALGLINWPKTTRVLDVGCGSGWAVYVAAQRLEHKEGGHAFGCDLSNGMLQQRVAHQAGCANAHFLLASGQSLPYRNDAFDALLCTTTFHHFPAPNDAMQEFRRVVRPGGKVIIADPCRDQSVGTWVWDRLHRWFEKGHVKYYRKEELFALLQDAGFEGITLTELNPPYSETRKLIPHAVIFSARV